MSWTCPHQSGAEPFCERLKTLCKPLQKGCVLAGKYKLVGGPITEDRTGGQPMIKHPAPPHDRGVPVLRGAIRSARIDGIG